MKAKRGRKPVWAGASGEEGEMERKNKSCPERWDKTD